MLAYIVRRILYFIPTVLGVALITFLLFRVVGGNPAYQLAGKNASAQEIADIEHQLGFDKPLFFNPAAAAVRGPLAFFDSQFVFHFKQALTFDFGRSWRTRQKISQIFIEGAGPSLSLAIPAFFLGVVISLALALLTAFRHNSMFDRVVVILCVAGLSVPFLVLIIACQYLVGYKWGLLPISGWVPGPEGIPYLVLPVLIWILSGLGENVRFFRTVVLDEVRSDYVTTARAKGLAEKTVMFKHVLKNAMIPILTNLIVAIPFLFTGSLLLETFFGIPGLGNAGVQALQNADWPLVNAFTYVGSVLFVAANLIADITYALVDPRVKLG
jgi:peptide/nickel transport system permease protein